MNPIDDGRIAIIDFAPEEESPDPAGRADDKHHGRSSDSLIRELKAAGLSMRPQSRSIARSSWPFPAADVTSKTEPRSGGGGVRGMIDGVATTPALRWTALPDDAGVRLDKFLASPDRLGSRARAATALERGKVFLNDREASLADAGRRLAAEDDVRVWQDRPGSAKREPAVGRTTDLDVVYEDRDIVVVNKPPGILTVPLDRRPSAPSVYGQIVERLRSHGKRKPFVVHRIDRDTSGLVLFARTPEAQSYLKAQFRGRTAVRVYLAVVYGHPQPAQGTWRDVLVWDQKALVQKETHPRDPRGTSAISHYRTLETFADAALIEVRLESGRRNQIRLQARLRGHALVGEQRYVFGPEVTRSIKFSRQALHARHLAVKHPSDGRRLDFEAPMPPDIKQLLKELRGARTRRTI